jgi:hypothetical protein
MKNGLEKGSLPDGNNPVLKSPCRRMNLFRKAVGRVGLIAMTLGPMATGCTPDSATEKPRETAVVEGVDSVEIKPVETVTVVATRVASQEPTEVAGGGLVEAIESQGVSPIEAPEHTFSEEMILGFGRILESLRVVGPGVVGLENGHFLVGEGDKTDIIYFELENGSLIATSGGPGEENLTQRLIRAINNKAEGEINIEDVFGRGVTVSQEEINKVIREQILIADGGWNNKMVGREIQRMDKEGGEVMAVASQDTGWRFEVSEEEVANWQSVVEVLMPNIGGTEISSPLRENIIYNISERAKRDGHIENIDDLRTNGNWVFRSSSDRENDSTLVETNFGIYEWYLDAGLGVWRIRTLEETVIMLDEAGAPIEGLVKTFSFGEDGVLTVNVKMGDGQEKGDFKRVFNEGAGVWEWEKVVEIPTSEKMMVLAPDVPGTEKLWDETAERVVYVENGVEVGGLYVWGEAENQRGIGLNAEFLARNYSGKVAIPVDPESIPQGADFSWSDPFKTGQSILFENLPPEAILVNPVFGLDSRYHISRWIPVGLSMNIRQEDSLDVVMAIHLGEGSVLVDGNAFESGVNALIRYGDPLFTELEPNLDLRGKAGIVFVGMRELIKIWSEDNLVNIEGWSVFLRANR